MNPLLALDQLDDRMQQPVGHFMFAPGVRVPPRVGCK